MLSWKQFRIHRAMCWRLGIARSFRCRQCARERPAVSGGGRNRRPKCLFMSANVTQSGWGAYLWSWANGCDAHMERRHWGTK